MNKKTELFRQKKGFTLLEILLALTLIIVIAGVTIPLSQSFQGKNDLDVAANIATQTLHRAQILAQASDGDSPWGVRIQTGSAVLFKGTSFAGRDTNFDETFRLASSLSVSGVSEIVFSKFTGIPQTSGTITFIGLNTGQTRSVTVNTKGMVNT